MLDLSRVGEPFATRLLSLHAGDPQHDLAGQLHPIDKLTGVQPLDGLWLFDKAIEMKATRTLEVGLANGVSALYFLAAAATNGGHHTALDPGQLKWWNGVGLQNLQSVGFANHLRFIDSPSERVLGRLLDNREQFDLIFIDGNHLYDAIMVDFYLAAPLVRLDGLLVLHDRWMRSTRSVLNFVRANRPDFRELPHNGTDLVILQRIDMDRRKWDDFQPFVVAE